MEKREKQRKKQEEKQKKAQEQQKLEAIKTNRKKLNKKIEKHQKKYNDIENEGASLLPFESNEPDISSMDEPSKLKIESKTKEQPNKTKIDDKKLNFKTKVVTPIPNQKSVANSNQVPAIQNLNSSIQLLVKLNTQSKKFDDIIEKYKLLSKALEKSDLANPSNTIVAEHFTEVAKNITSTKRTLSNSEISTSQKALKKKLHGKRPMNTKVAVAIAGVVGAIVGGLIGAIVGTAVTFIAGGVGGIPGGAFGAFLGFNIATGTGIGLAVGSFFAAKKAHKRPKQIKFPQSSDDNVPDDDVDKAAEAIFKAMKPQRN